ncbi:hypothetical protein LXL04_039741 [Taraxacum kok-saghyz]
MACTNAPDPIRTPQLSVLGREWTDDYGLVRHKRNKHGLYFGCDHTSTNAPDPIRTPQLSVLGREWTDDYGLVRHKRNKHGLYFGCDHTSTNAPDPIRTPQLSVLGESSTRMGDPLGSPRVAPLFFADRRRILSTRWTDDYGLVRHKRNKHGLYFGCDHTSTNAPDPIRTPQLSVLGREWTDDYGLVRHKRNKHGLYFGCDHTSTNAPDPIRTPHVKRAWARVWGPRHHRRLRKVDGRLWPGKHKRNKHGLYFGCDHTSTNAPDPIRTPQLSVLGPRVVLGWVTPWEVLVLHPSFLLIDGANASISKTHSFAMSHGIFRQSGSFRTPKLRFNSLDRRFDDPLQRGWTDDYGLVRHKRNKHGLYFGCDHTSTNAPDPIRTPQLSVLGRE